jgi:cell wall-associated NlpC family hydrolase
MTEDEVVARARGLVGTRFRPQGRDPDTGLDCVGLAIAAYGLSASSVRRNYRLHGPHEAELRVEISRFFKRVKDRESGDLMLCKAGADQLHLAIACDGSFIHADAGLRRVVETPGEPRWPVLGAYRLRKKQRETMTWQP